MTIWILSSAFCGVCEMPFIFKTREKAYAKLEKMRKEYNEEKESVILTKLDIETSQNQKIIHTSQQIIDTL